MINTATIIDWLVNELSIAPHVLSSTNHTVRTCTFSHEDFIYDEMRDIFIRPAGKPLTTTGHVSADRAPRYLASVPECRACKLSKQTFASMSDMSAKLRC